MKKCNRERGSEERVKLEKLEKGRQRRTERQTEIRESLKNNEKESE